MFRRAAIAAILSCMALPTLFAYGSYQAGATLNTMTAEEKRNTGVGRLNAQERKSLQQWIDTNYVSRPGESTGKYPTISEVLGNGSYVKLSDGTLWKIHPSDVAITQSWITPVEIIVEESGSTAYPYNLTNSLTGSSVRAQSASKLPDYLMKPQTPAQPKKMAPGKSTKPSLN